MSEEQDSKVEKAESGRERNNIKLMFEELPKEQVEGVMISDAVYVLKKRLKSKDEIQNESFTFEIKFDEMTLEVNEVDTE